ncbi:hypothetical protein CVIRNUC_010130 [Coccomyxa viridis]|uniref:Nop domain-containing protein n=1 Tax=Coccomyxa viridis TaxID=1274662 RepID=A0AAV1IHV9_9CHLO|nr:hypothetical protein CVIRNUC_010130 [Coccomyxa viridis]
MATLEDSFLRDLEDLSDDSGGEEDDRDAALPENDQMDTDEVEVGNFDTLESRARLMSSDRYKTIMERVHQALESGGEVQEERSWAGPSEEDPTYRLLVDCNQLAVDIDNEIAIVHIFMRDKYKSKFPELESLVHHPIDYARVVKAIGNEMDITLIDTLEDILPQATVMVVSVTASTTAGQPLSDDSLHKLLAACDAALQLDKDKAAILKLVQMKMHHIAPNLSAAVGTEIAARLMGIAGGLTNLSKMPACNVQVLGAKRKHLSGYSAATQGLHEGFIFGSEIIQGTPPAYRKKASRLVGGKCTLLARIDAYGQDPTGSSGASMKEDMRKKIEKWQEKGPAKQGRVLPVPDMEPKKRRGGKRARKYKERYGLTDTKKAANRMLFNQAEDEFLDNDEVVGMGTLGKEGSGRLRMQAQAQKQKMSAKAQKKFAKRQAYGSSLPVNGLSSTLAFTPIQGIELQNPTAHLQQQDADMRSGTESYFSEYTGFKSVKKPPPPTFG